jgi:ribosome-binding factor A
LFVERQRAWETGSEFGESGFASADFENSSGMGPISRKLQRKTQQFCRQVQRALNLALAEGAGEFLDCDIFVEQVSPAPDCGHLLVQIGIAQGKSIAEAMEAIRKDAARLRAEVAMAIARKRAPQLWFVPVLTRRRRR